MGDPFTRYEYGLARLLESLGREHSRYQEALSYQHQLVENIERARRYGDTAEHKADSRRILDQLNSLALATIGQSFNELAGIPVGGDLAALPPPAERLSDSSPPKQPSVNAIFQGPVQARDIVFGNQTTNNIANFHGRVGAVYYNGDPLVNNQAAPVDPGLQARLNELRVQLRAIVPSALADAGMQQIALLEQALNMPSPTRMAAVLDWVRAYLPSQARAFEGVIRHPAVMHKIMSAGAAVIAEFRSRFGEQGNEEL